MAFFKKKLAQGKPVAAKDVYVYETLPSALRIQLAQILGSEFDTAQRGPTYIRAADLWRKTFQSFAHDQGAWVISPGQPSPMEQCLAYLETQPSALLVLKLVQTGIRAYMEATHETNIFIPGGMSLPGPPPPLPIVAQVNQKLKEHRIGYEFVGGELHKIDSTYLHEETVKPALSLLNMTGFSGPEDEFLRAHAHLRAGEYQDAILDANNAFESTMKAICDLRGWTYDKGATAKALIGIMFGQDLIPRPLISQFEHLKGVLEAGLPTVRNKTGGHGQGSVPVAVPEYLAAYALHLAAANIVLLVEAHKAKS